MQQMLLKPINLILLIIFIVVLGGGGYATVHFGRNAITTLKTERESAAKLIEVQEKLTLLKEDKAKKPTIEYKTDKIIFESPDMAMSPEASFAPLFEMFVDTAKISGIRIRSIVYNYNPADDVIASAKLTNYNVCELEVKAVGSYQDFQTLFKTITKEPYVMSLAQMEFKPWEQDRTILVATFKLRLYTKTA